MVDELPSKLRVDPLHELAELNRKIRRLSRTVELLKAKQNGIDDTLYQLELFRKTLLLEKNK